MSKAIWWVPLATGLQDGVNPCLLITAALVFIGLLWCKRTGIHRAWSLLLIGSLLIDGFIFNGGFLDRFILNKYFDIAVRCIYGVLAVIVGLRGLHFFNRWYCLVKGKEIKSAPAVSVKPTALSLVFFIALTAFVLSLLASFWPVNYYIMVFSMYMLMPGQLLPLGSLILIYTAVSLWVVYLMIWLVGLEDRNQRLFNIIAAAVLLSASLGVIDILLMKGY